MMKKMTRFIIDNNNKEHHVNEKKGEIQVNDNDKNAELYDVPSQKIEREPVQ